APVVFASPVAVAAAVVVAAAPEWPWSRLRRGRGHGCGAVVVAAPAADARCGCRCGLGGQVKTGQSWTGQIRPVELGAGRGRLPRGGLVAQAVATELGAPASGAALEHVSVVEQSVEEGAGGGVVAEDLAPVLDRAVGGEDGRGTLVAAHDDFEDVLAGGGGQLAHAEIVEDEERDRRDGLDVALAFARELGVGQLLEEDVR